jgi:hypothetical protein
MTKFQRLAALVLTTASTPALCAAMHCPDNVESVRLRIIKRYQMIVPVSVNGAGPYDFLIDTGSAVTLIDSSLARELRLPLSGNASVAGAGPRASADLSLVESMAIGSQMLHNETVVVYDLPAFVSSQGQIRGILGESFLAHFDALIDVAHLEICLAGISNRDSVLGSVAKGAHIPLITSSNSGLDESRIGALVISVRLTNGTRPVRMKLDSGTNQAFLYNVDKIMDLPYYKGEVLHGHAIDGATLSFMVLPLQNVQIGSLLLPRVPFIARVNKSSETSGFDGLLAFNSFKQVFISHSNHYVILEPRLMSRKYRITGQLAKMSTRCH